VGSAHTRQGSALDPAGALPLHPARKLSFLDLPSKGTAETRPLLFWGQKVGEKHLKSTLYWGLDFLPSFGIQ